MININREMVFKTCLMSIFYYREITHERQMLCLIGLFDNTLHIICFMFQHFYIYLFNVDLKIEERRKGSSEHINW